ncbi:hypothetical protein [Delftia acidovorans]|uniref:hypothetical protein n=1 Tax=Delftia acidovorans TaxID=80866 RepID=UPI0003A8E7CE|nr:hypothetical protein [Delftia acidovorans]
MRHVLQSHGHAVALTPLAFVTTARQAPILQTGRKKSHRRCRHPPYIGSLRRCLHFDAYPRTKEMGMALNISIEQRFLTLLGQLKHMPPCSSRQEAHDMLLLLWMRICEGAGARRQLLNSMRQRTLCAEHGWKNLDKSPCYWDSETTPGIRIYLHANGTIVIQRQGGAQDSEILHFSSHREFVEA